MTAFANVSDSLSCARRTGEADHVDVRARGDRLTDDRAGAGDHVEHASGETNLVDDLGEHERIDRGNFARLQDHGASRGHCKGDLRCDLVQRIIPRRDATDDTDRLAHDE
jgi:hypothetical protein